MTGFELGLWGLFGGFASESRDFIRIARSDSMWPWTLNGNPDPKPYIVSIALRLILSGGLAWGAGISNQISGPFAAIAIGVGAPLILEQLSRRVPLTLPSEEAASTTEPATTSADSQRVEFNKTAADSKSSTSAQLKAGGRQ